MSAYPKPVAKYDAGHPADLAICHDCRHEYTFDPADGDPEDRCIRCPKDDCDGEVTFKYVEVDACRNCGKLGWESAAVSGCCSRLCALQHEYAQSLKGVSS